VGSVLSARASLYTSLAAFTISETTPGISMLMQPERTSAAMMLIFFKAGPSTSVSMVSYHPPIPVVVPPRP
jgi:hypothetical protein